MTDARPDFHIDGDKVEAYGANTARLLRLGGERRSAGVVREYRAALFAIRRRRDAAARERKGENESQAARWLLDNWYLAEREGRGAIADVAAAGSLRDTREGPLLPLLCRALLHSGELTKERLELYLTGFQSVTPLDRAELNLIVPCLRAELILELARLSARLVDGEGMARVFGALRLLASPELSALIERVDLTERALRRDPAGVYPLMDEATRDMYRREITRLAIKTQNSERRVAERVVAMAESAGEGPGRHVGHWIFTRPMGAEKRDGRGARYIASNVLATLALSLLCGFALSGAAAFFLLLIPLSELIKNLADLVVSKTAAPRRIPRMELAGGVPAEGRTVCVVSALLTGEDSGPALARRLEEFSLASRDCGEDLVFGLLADLPESKSKDGPADAAALEAAKNAVDGLNEKYGGGFYLLFRPRTFAEKDGVWRGYERKRGALLSLAALICSEESALTVLSGDGEKLRGARYILTLDADTVLGPGTARELIGAMLHPMNAPVLDEKRRMVVSGHGLIHPRMAVELSAANKSDFARIFAGQGGTDPYGAMSGEVTMDLFGRGGFAGKGIIDARALLLCSNEIPEGRVLSHDAVEGALLRGGYMGDVELTDGFPTTPLSYWRRMHRWTRGDWQNLIFLPRRGMSDADRWRLFDSLRRSLVAPMSLAAILAGFFMAGGMAVAALAALAALCSQLLISLATDAARPGEERRARYHSAVYHGASGALVNAVSRLVLLPAEAWVCFSAVCLSLWRMLVSKKGLLSWETASQSEKRVRGAAAYYRAMWFCVPVGVVSLLSPSVIGKAAGLIWLFSPLCALALGRERREARPLSDTDRRFLLDRAAELWRYFADFCDRENNHLPPDNWQEQPPVGLAHRTSPTNIGLALTSCLAALDLDLCPRDEALGLIDKMLGAVEKLPKWKGHLYNWYDTVNLRCLKPRYVSTVDSGNLAAALITLRAGLNEYGRPDLALRASELYEAMDFRPLYDKARRLFRIGYDASAGKLSEGCYDLLSSEARLAGYVAVARGDAPRSHWRALSRAQVSKDGFRGMASWSGSMFEYLMPEIFLPLCRDSLLWESARFCLYVQRRRVAPGAVWGVSESAFFSLDPQLDYRYKAHGCAALALRRGMDEELVVSPYSSYLALAVSPPAALRNLRRLQKLRPPGRYGLWEAYDFTPSRCAMVGEAVRCVMAHHLGMSLAAADNALTDGAMRRRFMSDPAMSSCRGLLEERLPIGALTLRRRGDEPPETPRRRPEQGWEKSGEGLDFERPDCCLLSNGAYSLALTESGLSRARAGSVEPYRAADGPFSERSGLCLRLKTPDADISLLPCRGEDALNFTWSFTSSFALFEGRGRGLSVRVLSAVSASDSCEARLVEIRSEAPLSGCLELSFEPTLARRGDYEAHPAFWRLGMSAEERDGALLLRRRARGERPECWLALSGDAPSEYRANAYGRALGDLSYPMATARVPVNIAGGGAFSARFVLAFGESADSALAAARRGEALGPEGFADLPAVLSGVYGLTARDVSAAMDMAGALIFPRPAVAPQGGREALWPFGVSGDLPIVCARLQTDEQASAAARIVSRHALLRALGLDSDLVFLTDEGGDYLRSRSRGLLDALARLGLEGSLGASGGVFIADAGMGGEVFESAADLVLPAAARERETGRRYKSAAGKRRGGAVETDFSDGVFRFTVKNALPQKAWANVLTDGGFGYLATDAGIGNMWYKNAREGRINRWLNDPLALSGPETLEAAASSGSISLFAAEDGLDCTVSYGFGRAAWEKTVGDKTARVTAFVPFGAEARVLIVEDAPGPLRWKTDLTLAAEDGDGRFVVTAMEDGVLTARNPRSQYPDAAFRAVFSAPPTAFTCSLSAWLRNEPGGESGAGLIPCFAAVLPEAETQIIVCGCGDVEKLKALAEPETARRALADTRRRWELLTGRLKVNTPDARLNNYLNGWAVYQALACRILGRGSLYQSGGAFGFRDQLQDAVNLLLIDPGLAKKQILACCAHQYSEGDVMHWWHVREGGDRGVRTRCSDDLLWLPWALCEYVDATGDGSLLAEPAPFMDSPVLADNEKSRYETPIRSGAESVLVHCARALALTLSRGVGEHGLLLTGSGDWNDGMDEVGGESVWLSWFFAHTARRFAALMESSGEKRDAAALLSAAMRIGRAADRAWADDRWLRGYWADGRPIGEGEGAGCEIDAIAQSWAAFCHEASPEKKNAALSAALDRLVDKKTGLARLFDPPFGEAEEPGYIKSYGPGFRENGGQYTHGAIWLAMALIREGRADEGYELLRGLLPREDGSYMAEPFVLAADVYSNPDRYGEAGWSWYTGAAGWWFRAVTGELLGIRLKNGKLTVDPRLPQHWNGFRALWTDPDGKEHNVEINK